jgi:predicted permease
VNIQEELLKEHSKTQALKIAAFACRSPQNFKKLMHCFLSNEYRVAQRAAWSVSWASIQQPTLIEPHITTLVAQLSKKNVHPAVVRNSLRILQNVHIPTKLHGKVMNRCFQFIEISTTPIAIQAFALKVIGNLAKFYPDIKNELKFLIEEKYDTQSAAFKASAKQVLKKFTNNEPSR